MKSIPIWIAILASIRFANAADDLTLERQYRESIAVLQRSAPSAILTDHLNSLGGLYYRQQLFERAEQLSRRALAVEQSLAEPRPSEIARSLGNIGSALADRGKPAQAREFLKRAATYRESDPSVLAAVYNALGVVELRSGKPHAAAKEFEAARRLWQGDPAGEAILLSNLAQAQAALGRHADSVAGFAEAVHLAEKAQIGDLARAHLLAAYSRELNRAGRKQESGEWKRRAKSLTGTTTVPSAYTIDARDLRN